jgi:hypothetical protein
MPSDKAPGPDGFTGAFFKICWVIIKEDVMIAVTLIGNLHVASFHWLNYANIALLPKKDGAEDISELRPISYWGSVQITKNLLPMQPRICPRTYLLVML